jgi:hypothetical protein
MKEIRIPVAGLTDEGFIALKAQMRILFGMPAEVMPQSAAWLHGSLHQHWSDYPFRRWLAANGYEVLQPGVRGTYYVIRPSEVTATERILADNMGKRMVANLDQHVLTALCEKFGV